MENSSDWTSGKFLMFLEIIAHSSMPFILPFSLKTICFLHPPSPFHLLLTLVMALSHLNFVIWGDRTHLYCLSFTCFCDHNFCLYSYSCINDQIKKPLPISKWSLLWVYSNNCTSEILSLASFFFLSPLDNFIFIPIWDHTPP